MAKKAKGLVRLKSFIPLLCVSLFIIIYVYFLLDSHLKLAMEGVGASANGAEVNVGSVTSDFGDASLLVSNLQVTDPKAPDKNRLSIDRIKFALLWDGLLSGKFIVEEASVLGVASGQLRKERGFVLEKEEKEEVTPAKEESGSSSEGLKNLVHALEKSVNADSIKNIDLNELPSKKKVMELESSLLNKQKDWQQKIKSLPSSQDFEKDKQKIAALGAAKDPRVIKENLENIKKTLNNSKARLDSVKNVGSQISSDIGAFQKDVSALKGLYKEDMSYLESKLKLPKLDVKNLGREIFGAEFDKYLADANKYMAMVQKYMPPKNAKEQEPAPERNIRYKGVNYEFGAEGDYPLFWVKKTLLSTHGGKDDGVKGEISHVSSSQMMTGKETILSMTGGFKEEGIRGVDLKMVFDHRDEVAKDEMRLKIGGFPIKEKVLSQSRSLALKIKEAKGKLDAKMQLVGGQIDLEVKTAFDEVSYHTETSSQNTKTMLSSALKNMANVLVTAKAAGDIKNPKITVTSNLSSALKEAFEGALKKKLLSLKKELREKVEKNLAEKKAQLEAKLLEAKKPVVDKVDRAKKDAEKVKALAQSKIDQGRGALEAKKKALEKALSLKKAKAKAKLEAAKKQAKKEAEKKAKDKASEKAKQKLKSLGF